MSLISHLSHGMTLFFRTTLFLSLFIYYYMHFIIFCKLIILLWLYTTYYFDHLERNVYSGNLPFVLTIDSSNKRSKNAQPLKHGLCIIGKELRWYFPIFSLRTNGKDVVPYMIQDSLFVFKVMNRIHDISEKFLGNRYII